MDSVNVRNLEQIQEADHQKRSRWSPLLLSSLGGAALVVSAVMTMNRAAPPARAEQDPLSALVAKTKRADEAPAERVDQGDVTFPAILSDTDRPTTALAAVKDERGQLIERSAATAGALPTAPPPPADKLPVVPLPAGSLLMQTPVTSEPKDGLTELAVEVAKVEGGAEVLPGMEGGYQVQVASFKDEGDANAFVEQLRKRGHRAFRQAAYVADRGLWHRVRIGPFKTKYAAEQYQRDFEKAERMSTFLVDPDKVKRQEQIRAAKLATRMQKYGRP